MTPVISNPRTRFQVLSSVLLAVIIVLIIVPGGFILDRRPPVSSSDVSLKVLLLSGRPVIEIERKIDWSRYCEGHSARELIDASGNAYPLEDAYYGPPKKLGPDTTRYHIQVPETIHGRIRFRSRQDFVCNILQRNFPIILHPQDLEFEVP